MEEPHYRVVHVKCFGDPDGLEVGRRWPADGRPGRGAEFATRFPTV